MNIKEEIELALKSANERALLGVLYSVTKQEIKAAFDDSKWIFCRICELGFSSALQYVLDLHVSNVNDAYDGWTPMQYACKAGHTEVVRHLLKWDSVVKQDVWREDSEFYLVSYYGHLDTAKILYEKYRDLVEDTEVCFSLLYAACHGGHLPLVHMWLKPGHDINQLVTFVPSLDKCEYRYPLFAACQGEHMEVAASLIKDFGACLTQEICENFTDFTAKLVNSFSLVTALKGELLFCLTKLKVEYPVPQWFYQKDDGEDNDDNDDINEMVILSVGNSLKKLSGEILWHLPGLVQLDISNNPSLRIEEPLRPSELIMNRLVSLDVSHCDLESISSYFFMLPCLEDLNLSHNKLAQLGDSHSWPTDGKWKCERLKILNVSHNKLSALPAELQGCPNIDSLVASHNQMVSLCPPWTCPLSSLNVSHNKLSSFPPSANSFWKNSLKHLFIQHNQLDILPSSVVALDALRHLNASHNKIVKLPPSECWRCRLFYLDLSHNEIGVGVRKASLSRVMSVKNYSPSTVTVSFRGASMLRTVTELYLGMNNLKSVPEGVADMSNLSLLDLKKNPLTSLPWDLGRLQKLLILDLEGIHVEDEELQSLIESLNNMKHHPSPLDSHGQDKRSGDGIKSPVSARDVIMYLESRRRECIPTNIFKVVVLGKKKRFNEQTLIQQLANRKKNSEATPDLQHQQMLSIHIPLLLNRKSWKTKQPAQAVVWEFSDTKFTSSVLPCFLTLNTVYLVQIEMYVDNTSDTCLKKLSEKVASIQACVLRPDILVVLTFPEGTSKSDVQRTESDLIERQRLGQFEFSDVKFFSLYGGSRNLLQQIDQLWEKIEDICADMTDSQFGKKRTLTHRKVPQFFLQVYQRIMKAREKENLYVCTMAKFLEITGCSCDDLKDCLEPGFTLEEFLLQSGAILHYSDFNQDLSNCIFLDPVWLFKTLITFLKSLTSNMARLPVIDVSRKAEELLPKDFDYFPAFLALLEAFNIGFRILDSRNRNALVIPSLLQEYPPHCELPEYSNGLKAARLYCTPPLPLAMWSHIISQLILAFNRLSHSHWKLGAEPGDSISSQIGSDVKMTADIAHHKSFKMSKHQSMSGLKLSDKNIQFWRTGIFISHDQGYVVVEQVECSDKTGQKTPGILVNVQTNESSTKEENLRKLAVIGIITDELEEILEMFVPKFNDPLALELKPYVLCPLCHNTTPMSGSIMTDGIHFTARDCAQEMLRKDIIVCQGGPTSLQHLVPELFFLELPNSMRLNFKDIKLKTDEKLGRGIAGEVLKGCFKDQEVAVKVFHQHQAPKRDECLMAMERSGIGHYTNCHPPNRTNELAQRLEDKVESEQRKISNAFSEMRREVGILSKLQHRCVVTFLGVCVHPHLLLVMELAPLGSLRSELERRSAMTEDEKRALAAISGNSKVISEMVFSKNITYKMILQIASGLSHLHSHQIIFRDLKPDNILLMSLDENASINVKLSDYGISKFATLQGICGLYGTVGYIAPEVLTKQAYTQKVDIFSLGVVMGEVLTGIPPVASDQASRVSDIANDGVSPGHMQGYEVQCNFPCLEELMKECWSSRSERRPEAADILKRMNAERFLLMHDSVWLDEMGGLEVTCVQTCETSGHWKVWVCESSPDRRRFFSVYDISANCFSVRRKESSPGPAVTAMLKVETKVWLACQSDRTLYTLDRGSEMKFEISPRVYLDSIPTKLIHFKSVKNQTKNAIVLAGLEDGCVASIYYSVCGKTCTISKHELDSDLATRSSVCQPVVCICQVGTRYVAVASGEDIHTFQVTHDDVSSAGTANKAIVSYSTKTSLKSVTEGFVPVASITSQGEKAECDTHIVWCCMERSPYLVQIDVSLAKIMSVIYVSWTPGQDLMRLERKPFLCPARGYAASDSCIRLSENMPEALHMTGNDVQIPSQRDNADEVFLHAGFAGGNERGNTSTVDGSNHVANTLENSNDGNQVESQDSLKTEDETTTIRFDLTRSLSLPCPTESRPPPIPPRQGRAELGMNLHSLSITEDVLMIGTSCGGLLALPLTSVNDPDDTVRGGGHPLHLGVFWHQQRAKSFQPGEGRSVQRRGSTSSSHSTASCLPSTTTPSQQIPEGEISLLLHAGTRMVSIYTHQEKAILRSRTTSNISLGDTFQQTRLASPAMIQEVNHNRYDSTESISNITVWDDISSKKLSAIEGYCFGMS